MMRLPAGAVLDPATDPRDRLILEIDESLREFGASLPADQRNALDVRRQEIFHRYEELTGQCICRIGVAA